MGKLNIVSEKNESERSNLVLCYAVTVITELKSRETGEKVKFLNFIIYRDIKRKQ